MVVDWVSTFFSDPMVQPPDTLFGVHNVPRRVASTELQTPELRGVVGTADLIPALRNGDVLFVMFCLGWLALFYPHLILDDIVCRYVLVRHGLDILYNIHIHHVYI